MHSWFGPLVVVAVVVTGCGARTELSVTEAGRGSGGPSSAGAGNGGSGGGGTGGSSTASAGGGGSGGGGTGGSSTASAGGGGSGGGGGAATTAVSVSAGSYHACAVTVAGAVKCWGYNADGQLGDGSTTRSYVPVDVAGLSSGVAAVAAGGDHTCALTRAGGVACWGGNEFGQLGNGTVNDSHVPVDVVGLSSGVTAIAASYGSTCALTQAGTVVCWGMILDSAQIVSATVPGLSEVVSVTLGVNTGDEQACVVTSAGAAECWGSNFEGQLGDGTMSASDVPVGVVGLSSGARAISAGYSDTCAVIQDGTVECWGDNWGLWKGLSSDVPVDVMGFSADVVALSVGSTQACAITSAGAAECWGTNELGQLGDGSTTDSVVPVGVVGLSSGVLAISAGAGFTCAITRAGQVECWGENVSGQLGDGSTTPSSVPVRVVGL